MRFHRWRASFPRGLMIIWAVTAVFAVWFVVLASKWPFTQRAVVAALEQETKRTVRIDSFHSTFFPPGYVAENITLLNPSANVNTAAITARRLIIIARWSDLLLMRKRIEQGSLEGLRMRVVPLSPDATKQPSSPVTQPRFDEIGTVRLDDASFSFPLDEADDDPLTITVRSLLLSKFNRTASSPFRALVTVSDPKSAIHLEGQIGPWNWNDSGRTPLDGSFTIDQADLSALGGIAGDFTGKVRFRGPLRQIACDGSVDVPRFRVLGHDHSAHLFATFQSTVNGLNGDTTLDRVQAKLNNTLLQSEGEIKEDANKPGKAASLHVSVDNGQIEDFLTLFAFNARPAMTGAVRFQANVDLPPGAPGFLEKVRIHGDFDITHGRFTKVQTQQTVNRLSKSAEGMRKSEAKVNPRVVFSELKGHVVAQGGTATFTHFALAAPGAHADISGTYNLTNTTLNLKGLLRTTGKLSDTTSGLKTALLKVITPLWKHKSATVVPFTISGKAKNPTFALDIVKRRRS